VLGDAAPCRFATALQLSRFVCPSPTTLNRRLTEITVRLFLGSELAIRPGISQQALQLDAADSKRSSDAVALEPALPYPAPNAAHCDPRDVGGLVGGEHLVAVRGRSDKHAL
jgi:hypothetical protein